MFDADAKYEDHHAGMSKETKTKMKEAWIKRQEQVKAFFANGYLDEREKPIIRDEAFLAHRKTQPGLSIILHQVEEDKKTREVVVVNKLHYCLGTNEFIKFQADAVRDKELRSLKEFLLNYRFADPSTIELYGCKLKEYQELLIFESTDVHKQVLGRQFNDGFHVV